MPGGYIYTNLAVVEGAVAVVVVLVVVVDIVDSLGLAVVESPKIIIIKQKIKKNLCFLKNSKNNNSNCSDKF